MAVRKKLNGSIDLLAKALHRVFDEALEKRDDAVLDLISDLDKKTSKMDSDVGEMKDWLAAIGSHMKVRKPTKRRSSRSAR